MKTVSRKVPMRNLKGGIRAVSGEKIRRNIKRSRLIDYGLADRGGRHGERAQADSKLRRDMK